MATADLIADMGNTLEEILTAALPGIDVQVASPDDFSTFGQVPALSIFLYHVGINPELRNGPAASIGNTVSRPLLPLDLRYLITPWVKEVPDSHRVVGLVLQALYDRATLGPSELSGSSWGPQDTVQVVYESLSVSDHYNIWETTELPYRLSLTYLVRILGLSPGEVTSTAPVVTAEFGGP